ncbi:hypothetical protein C7M84_003490 [Penaeus vannamei]|uniref:Uncharacterized protein n=1 Tax=Penaeus vannamei TaxID=6689 RepID=A0A3R7N5H0_PENVA|nr:hypothetical protein C7M84_003490 [Penaeus vannamei]
MREHLLAHDLVRMNKVGSPPEGVAHRHRVMKLRLGHPSDNRRFSSFVLFICDFLFDAFNRWTFHLRYPWGREIKACRRSTPAIVSAEPPSAFAVASSAVSPPAMKFSGILLFSALAGLLDAYYLPANTGTFFGDQKGNAMTKAESMSDTRLGYSQTGLQGKLTNSGQLRELSTRRALTVDAVGGVILAINPRTTTEDAAEAVNLPHFPFLFSLFPEMHLAAPSVLHPVTFPSHRHPTPFIRLKDQAWLQHLTYLGDLSGKGGMWSSAQSSAGGGSLGSQTSKRRLSIKPHEKQCSLAICKVSCRMKVQSPAAWEPMLIIKVTPIWCRVRCLILRVEVVRVLSSFSLITYSQHLPSPPFLSPSPSTISFSFSFAIYHLLFFLLRIHHLLFFLFHHSPFFSFAIHHLLLFFLLRHPPSSPFSPSPSTIAIHHLLFFLLRHPHPFLSPSPSTIFSFSFAIHHFRSSFAISSCEEKAFKLFAVQSFSSSFTSAHQSHSRSRGA